MNLGPRSCCCPNRQSVRRAPSCLGVRFAAVAISFPTTLIRVPNIDAMMEVHTGQRDATPIPYVTAGASIVTKVEPKKMLTRD